MGAGHKCRGFAILRVDAFESSRAKSITAPMKWVEVIFGATMGACAWLAGANLLIWLRDRRALAQLSFSIAAASVMALAFVELRMMQTRDPKVYFQLFRWYHCAGYGALVGSLAFTHCYLGSGRRWFGLLVVGVATIVLVPNFFPGTNSSFAEVQTVQRVMMWGQPVTAIGRVTPSAMMPWLELSHVLWWLYTVDAVVRLWRRNREGDRRRVIVIGGPAIVAIFLSAVAPILLYSIGWRWPLVVSLSFTSLMVALGYELSEDVARASRTARALVESQSALRESEQRLQLVLEAADLAAWVWDVSTDEVWITPKGRALFGFAEDERLDRERFFRNLHPDDRGPVETEVKGVLENGGSFSREYRRVYQDGSARWIAGRGRAECDASGRVVRVRGVSVDVTSRVEAAEALAAQRRELAQLSRVAMLGELSGSLAHELSQPLASILSNAEVAQGMLKDAALNREELSEILGDILTADRHAAEIIKRVRAMLKGGNVPWALVEMNEVVNDVLRLMRGDIIDRGVKVETRLASALPPIFGDRVQLQQVILNLLLNACDAMSGNARDARKLVISTESVNGSTIRVSVADTGSGIAPELRDKLFEAFRTTKAHGLGLGLSVSRSIVASHGGTLAASDNQVRGTIFHFTLQAAAPTR